MAELCRFCGSSDQVVDGVCSICVRGWDYGLDLELQEELDALERPISQACIAAEELGGGC